MTTGDPASRLARLDRLYAFYDGFLAGEGPLACREGCAACCTADVVLTSLEAYALVTRLTPRQRTDLEAALAAAPLEAGFRPGFTTNTLAEICARGEEPPDEKAPQGTHRCPLLANDRCPIYPLRPFGCRCLVSRRDCRERGWAEVEDRLVTLNTVFLQVLEHVDRPGWQGSFADLLRLMLMPGSAAAYAAGRLDGASCGLLPNRPLKVLMVPPKHRPALTPLVAALRPLVAREPGSGQQALDKQASGCQARREPMGKAQRP